MLHSIILLCTLTFAYKLSIITIHCLMRALPSKCRLLSMTMTKNDNENMFITIDLHIYKIQDARYKYTENKHKTLFFSLVVSMVKGHETEASGPQFRLYNRKHFILRLLKTGNGAAWEKNNIIYTKFKEWNVTHTWPRESSNIYKTINIDLGFNFIF